MILHEFFFYHLAELLRKKNNYFPFSQYFWLIIAQSWEMMPICLLDQFFVAKGDGVAKFV